METMLHKTAVRHFAASIGDDDVRIDIESGCYKFGCKCESVPVVSVALVVQGEGIVIQSMSPTEAEQLAKHLHEASIMLLLAAFAVS